MSAQSSPKIRVRLWLWLAGAVIVGLFVAVISLYLRLEKLRKTNTALRILSVGGLYSDIHFCELMTELTDPAKDRIDDVEPALGIFRGGLLDDARQLRDVAVISEESFLEVGEMLRSQGRLDGIRDEPPQADQQPQRRIIPPVEQ